MKKGVVNVVVVLLFLLITVVSIVNYQFFFSNFQSSILTEIENNYDIKNGFSEISGIVGTNLYFKNNYQEITVIDIIVDNTNCLNNQLNYSYGMLNFNIEKCLNYSKELHEVTVITNKDVFTKNFYLKLPKPITNGLLLPLYIYPSSGINTPEFQQLITLKKSFPNIPFYGIINPNNGPGNSIDTNYANISKELNKEGIILLGYIHSTYANRNATILKQEMLNWSLFYPEIKGFFIDEMSYENNDTKINYYYDILNYSKSTLGYSIHIGNPGIPVDSRYYSDLEFNFIVMYENSNYPTLTEFQTNQMYKDRKAVLIYNQNYNESLLQTSLDNSNLIYLTNDNLPNPWDSLGNELDKVLNQIIT
jgi:effector-binding domain-containing protein